MLDQSHLRFQVKMPELTCGRGETVHRSKCCKGGVHLVTKGKRCQFVLPFRTFRLVVEVESRCRRP